MELVIFLVIFHLRGEAICRIGRVVIFRFVIFFMKVICFMIRVIFVCLLNRNNFIDFNGVLIRINLILYVMLRVNVIIMLIFFIFHLVYYLLIIFVFGNLIILVIG